VRVCARVCVCVCVRVRALENKREAKGEGERGTMTKEREGSEWLQQRSYSHRVLDVRGVLWVMVHVRLCRWHVRQVLDELVHRWQGLPHAGKADVEQRGKCVRWERLHLSRNSRIARHLSQRVQASCGALWDVGVGPCVCVCCVLGSVFSRVVP
jgi:hypothetical protein